jgi:hypothetical protein
MLNAELLLFIVFSTSSAVHVAYCAGDNGLRMSLSVLNIPSSYTEPVTVTITDSATLTYSPNLSQAPKRVASPQISLAERGAGGGG